MVERTTHGIALGSRKLAYTAVRVILHTMHSSLPVEGCVRNTRNIASARYPHAVATHEVDVVE
jgi:hypothetical protein